MKLTRQFAAEASGTAIALLAAAVPELSKARLKDAMIKGAVQLLGKPNKRLRRAQFQLQPGAQLALHYDEAILQRVCPAAQLLFDERDYSVWYKPAGMLSQGNEWGDHLSLLRVAEQHFSPARQVFLLHRLDREASGLVVIAHTKRAAAALSQLIAKRDMTKYYQIRVVGQLSADNIAAGVIKHTLDGKPCETRFSLIKYCPDTNTSLLQIDLVTGRKHQIRRHFAGINHAVLGDPQYGKHNKYADGLALQATMIRFHCPLKRKPQQFELPRQWWLGDSYSQDNTLAP